LLPHLGHGGIWELASAFTSFWSTLASLERMISNMRSEAKPAVPSDFTMTMGKPPVFFGFQEAVLSILCIRKPRRYLLLSMLGHRL